MKKLLLLLALLVAGPLLPGCQSFLDKNDDPNSPTETTPNFLLPSIISNGLAIQGFTALRTAFITQYVASRAANAGGTDQYFLTTAQSNPTFNNTYFLVGGNIGPMIKLAEAEGSAYYVGAGKIMMALILSHATDMLGDIPYREAFQGERNFTPAYDPQEQLYGDIQTLLDEGITEMSKPASENKRPFYTTAPVPNGSGDILYRGDVQKWIRLAYSLKARQLQHLTKKGAKYEPAKVLEFAAKGFASSADDCQLQFQTPAGPLINTTNIFGPFRNNFAASTFAGNFIKFLNGGTYAGVIDPRLPIMATATSPGAEPGRGGGPQPTTSATDFYSSWYARDLGYQEVITYHELQFIRAEAAFLSNQKALALTAYREGIRAHMAKIGVGGTTTTAPIITFPAITAAQITAYLASPAVAQTEAELASPTNANVPRAIMQQKYIALFLNPESWTDMRRYDFSLDIYPNLVFPASANGDAGGEYPRRLLPAEREVVLNTERVRAFGGLDPKFFTKKVWWDE